MLPPPIVLSCGMEYLYHDFCSYCHIMNRVLIPCFLLLLSYHVEWSTYAMLPHPINNNNNCPIMWNGVLIPCFLLILSYHVEYSTCAMLPPPIVLSCGIEYLCHASYCTLSISPSNRHIYIYIYFNIILVLSTA